MSHALPVILSEVKDLIALQPIDVLKWHKVLPFGIAQGRRCAQDDRHAAVSQTGN